MPPDLCVLLIPLRNKRVSAKVVRMTQNLDRYHRQMLLAGFGESGQRRLQDATVLLLGCGALGSVAADLLARAGVGHLVIVDRDVVEATNLQRQVLFDEQDAADSRPKAEAAVQKLRRINSEASSHLGGYDITSSTAIRSTRFKIAGSEPE